MTAHSNDRAGRLAFLEEILGSLIFRSTQYWWNPVLGQGWGAFGLGGSSEAVELAVLLMVVVGICSCCTFTQSQTLLLGLILHGTSTAIMP